MDRRARYRQGLSGLYLPYYDALCEELSLEWQPYSGIRTFTQQAALYLQGRETPGDIVTNAHAGESPHNYGCASDWCLWDDSRTPQWPPKSSPYWLPYVQAIEKIGLRAGFSWGDAPHNELLISCTWKTILEVFSENGMAAAQERIKNSHQGS